MPCFLAPKVTVLHVCPYRVTGAALHKILQNVGLNAHGVAVVVVMVMVMVMLMMVMVVNSDEEEGGECMRAELSKGLGGGGGEDWATRKRGR